MAHWSHPAAQSPAPLRQALEAMGLVMKPRGWLRQVPLGGKGASGVGLGALNPAVGFTQGSPETQGCSRSCAKWPRVCARHTQDAGSPLGPSAGLDLAPRPGCVSSSGSRPRPPDLLAREQPGLKSRCPAASTALGSPQPCLSSLPGHMRGCRQGAGLRGSHHTTAATGTPRIFLAVLCKEPHFWTSQQRPRKGEFLS